MSKYLNDPKADTAGESCEQWPLSQVETTLKDLKEAFAGESQANRKYLAYAAAAEKEGLVGVAKLFKAAAAAETVHEGPVGRTGKGTRSGIVFTNRADVAQSRCPAGRRDCRVGPQTRGRAPQGA